MMLGNSQTTYRVTTGLIVMLKTGGGSNQVNGHWSLRDPLRLWKFPSSLLV